MKYKQFKIVGLLTSLFWTLYLLILSPQLLYTLYSLLWAFCVNHYKIGLV